METSDGRTLSYCFDQGLLKAVSGSHSIPCSYEYKSGTLVKIRFPEGRDLTIDYDRLGRVSKLKRSGIVTREFIYGQGCTEVLNADSVKTRYSYDMQLHSIDYFDDQNRLVRTDRKYYEKSRLAARTVADGDGRIFSYRSMRYDGSGNVIEEKLYGNLTGKQDPI